MYIYLFSEGHLTDYILLMHNLEKLCCNMQCNFYFLSYCKVSWLLQYRLNILSEVYCHQC